MLRCTRGLTGALTALVLSGCDCGGGDGLSRVEAILKLEPESLDFDVVPLGATKRMELRISNIGSANLLITGVDAPAPFFASSDPITIPPGETRALDVGVSPQMIGELNGQLALASNAPDKPMVTVPLRANCVESTLSVRPQEIDFSATLVGTERSAEIVVENVALVPATGRLVTELFPRPESFFLSSLERFDQPAVFTIAERSQATYELRYRPLATGVDDGRVVFEICGPRCGLEVSVRATASEALVRIEPPVLDFGVQGIGETRTQQVVLTNGGGETVQITSVSIQGSSEFVPTAARGLPATLTPGDAMGINVAFTPSSAFEFSGQLVVRTSDPVLPEVRASLVGEGSGPLFLAVPNPVSFGVQRQPSLYRRAVLLVNSGSSDVRVESVAISGAPELRLDRLPGFPVRLAGGESLNFDATFQPVQLGGYEATITVVTDDPAAARTDIPVTGGLADRVCEVSFTPDRINYGLMPVGFSRTKSAVMRNVGSSDCNFVSAAFRVPLDPAFTALNAAFPTTLVPGQSITLDFSYTPTLQIESKANFVMVTDDPVFPERHLALFGSAKDDLDVFMLPPVLDFGGLAVGCMAQNRTTVLVNGGTRRVTFTGYSLSSSGEFSVLSAPANFTPIDGGRTEGFQIGYEPMDIGVDTHFLEVTVAELALPLAVPLEGEGLGAGQASDDYVQSRNDKVDVLFVIDDSCSMADDQADLARNFSSFIRAATLRSVDFQIGVTTTTLIPSAGTMVGNVLTSATANLEGEFTSQVNVGSGGSGREQGLEAMSGALRLADAGILPNRVLFRPDAALVVIIVSDEDDQSPASTVTYLGDLRSRYQARGFTTATVTGEINGCVGMTNGSAVPAIRYMDFSMLTGGVSESICADWAMTLSSIGNAVFGLRKRFTLSNPANTMDPIVVTVDGVPAAAGTWSYDPADHSVVFSTPPVEGSMITIQYTPSC